MLLKSNFSSYPQYFYVLLSFYVRTGTRLSLRDKRLFEITEVEIARVDCSFWPKTRYHIVCRSYCRKLVFVENKDGENSGKLLP